VDPGEPPEPSTIGSCGAATVTLDFVRPNLYFAIDASGSMSDDIPRADVSATGLPSARYPALAVAIRTLLTQIGHRVDYGATLFPTGDITCDAGEEIMALGPGDSVSFAVSGEIGPVLRSFMFGINRRTPRGGTPTAQALRGLLPRLSLEGPETYVFLVTDGGPNCNADTHCLPEQCIPNLERVRLSETLVCDESINCCDPGVFGPENCLDASGSLAAVRALAAAGVRTFVIGIPGSEAFGNLLDQLAVAGGVARAESPRYYQVADAEALLSTLSTLGQEVALSCRIELAEPPPDPELVNLFFDGELVPANPVNGWTLSGERSVEVVGAACEMLKSGQVLQADVIAGCPIVLR
jgi:hypothetical protein